MCSANKSTLVFFVNGKKVEDAYVDPEWTLLYYLRNKLRLIGTKLGCAEGGCGACTVMVSKYDRLNDKILHIAVNACLAPVCSMYGLAVTTVEGIGSVAAGLHPVQKRIAAAHGSQCGFCTPGIVMSMYTLLRNKTKPNAADLDTAFQGNICRCTGYRPILDAFDTFTEEWEQSRCFAEEKQCLMGAQCCKKEKHNQEESGNLYEKSKFIPYSPTQEPIFPPELKLENYDEQVLEFHGKQVKWFRPTTLTHLLKLKQQYPHAKLIVGNTEIGVEVKFKHMHYPILIQTNYIQELTSISITENVIKFGASVTLDQIDITLKDIMKAYPPTSTKIFAAIVDMLYYFASKQIRNVSAVGGNIITSSPISDLNPIFLAANCVLEVQSKKGGTRQIIMDDKFFTGYRKNLVLPEEVLVAINIPFTTKNQFFYAYKQARRRDDDIAIVNLAINVFLNDINGEKIICDIKMAYGGMAPTTVMALRTQEALKGEIWRENMLEKAYLTLMKDLPLDPGAPGGMITYRRCLTLSLFFRSYLAISRQLELSIPEDYLSGIEGFHCATPKGSQYFTIKQKGDDIDEIGRPVVMLSAYRQASGEALYVDDLSRREGELYMALVVSTRAHALIKQIDASEAIAMEGVHAFFSAKDLEVNQWGPVVHDDQVFVSEKVTAQGQVLGCIVAEEQSQAQAAARRVQVTYEDLTPVIISIEDAIKHKSYYPDCPMVVEAGDVDSAFKNAENVVQGEYRTGAQEHFYLETQCVLVVPKKEDDEIEIYASTQHPSEVSNLVSEVLQIPTNHVVTKTKRIGGGFGGKESRSCMLVLPAAVAAHRLGRPVRSMLDRDEDMLLTGCRHPFLVRYKAAVDHTGKILACEVYMYNNAGCSIDLSKAVMTRAMLHFQNAYYIEDVRVLGYVCKTNLPSNTAFRGFGGPQGMLTGEYIIRDISEKLKLPAENVARLNLYQDGQKTHYNQQLEYCTLVRCWDECIDRSAFHCRKTQVEQFNSRNRWKKRGLSIVPTMFGISFTEKFLNQTGALVLIYLDGSVLVCHGGVEMGQGLHTKTAQVASKALGIPLEQIHIAENATDKIPNTSATAASVGSDLNGMAVLNACNILNERLAPYKMKHPDGIFKDWVRAAYFDQIPLSACGFYCISDFGYDAATKLTRLFNYFTFGAACSEVELDCLTGDHVILRTDIVMDLGESLNPAIDVGQIEGAFMQGYGLFVLEEMLYSPNGAPLTRGPGTYKLPGFGNIPQEFNVSLLKGAPNPRAVYASKAVGEPPLFLASSILFALREAINASRKDAGVMEPYMLTCPATADKIRMGCIDQLTSKFAEAPAGSYKPWNVIP